MFDEVAPRYDLVNDLLSLGQDRHWRAQTVAAVRPRSGERILDLAAGTGTSSRPFADAGAFVVPADLSAGMLTVGKQRQPQLAFVNADALALPFADGVFDAVTISFGLRNVEDVPGALAELHRVSRPGGRIVTAGTESTEPDLASWTMRAISTLASMKSASVSRRLSSSAVSSACTSPKWRSGRTRFASRGNAPTTGKPTAVSASDTKRVWRALPTRLRMTPAISTRSRKFMKPRATAAAVWDWPETSSTRIAGQPVAAARSELAPLPQYPGCTTPS
ncbi:MAG: class I SAM-dependent methyltransferase [Hyphomicrobium denitrificans]|nr:class I SAM-dependent methyltransferase [Hyphomicrobium denitrificans]